MLQLGFQPAVIDAEGRVYVFKVYDPTPPGKVRLAFKRLIQQNEEFRRLHNKPPLTYIEKMKLKTRTLRDHNGDQIRKKHEINGTHAVRDIIFHPSCMVGLYIRGYITSKHKRESAFMDAEGNFFEIEFKEFKEKADWGYSHPEPVSLDYTTMRPMLTNERIRVRREVNIKIQKFAKIIFPLFIETLEMDQSTPR